MGPWTKASTILTWLALCITPLTVLAMASPAVAAEVALGFNTATSAMSKGPKGTKASIFEDVCGSKPENYEFFKGFISKKHRWDEFLRIHGYENDANSRGNKRKICLKVDVDENGNKRNTRTGALRVTVASFGDFVARNSRASTFTSPAADAATAANLPAAADPPAPTVATSDVEGGEGDVDMTDDTLSEVAADELEDSVHDMDVDGPSLELGDDDDAEVSSTTPPSAAAADIGEEMDTTTTSTACSTSTEIPCPPSFRTEAELETAFFEAEPTWQKRIAHKWMKKSADQDEQHIHIPLAGGKHAEWYRFPVLAANTVDASFRKISQTITKGFVENIIMTTFRGSMEAGVSFFSRMMYKILPEACVSIMKPLSDVQTVALQHFASITSMARRNVGRFISYFNKGNAVFAAEAKCAAVKDKYMPQMHSGHYEAIVPVGGNDSTDFECIDLDYWYIDPYEAAILKLKSMRENRPATRLGMYLGETRGYGLGMLHLGPISQKHVVQYLREFKRLGPFGEDPVEKLHHTDKDMNYLLRNVRGWLTRQKVVQARVSQKNDPRVAQVINEMTEGTKRRWSEKTSSNKSAKTELEAQVKQQKYDSRIANVPGIMN